MPTIVLVVAQLAAPFRQPLVSYNQSAVSILLDGIISLAGDGKQPLPDILRKCLRLGHELKNDRLKTWAAQETTRHALSHNKHFP
jgi:hypothetical protein